MKKLLLFFCIITVLNVDAQIELVPNPSDINSGNLTFKYGEFGDYSIFDPLSNPNLYLYTGLQTDADPVTWDYNDGEFTTQNLVNMIALNFDTNLGYYVATFNPATRMYFEEASQTVVNLPNGLDVFDWYFLITTNDLSRQSSNLRGSDYGFGSATLSSNFNESVLNSFALANKTLHFYKPGNYQVSIYDVLGKQILNESISVISEYSFEPKLQSKGLYLIRVSTDKSFATVKMIYH